MSYRQYTRCCAPGSHLGQHYAQVVIAAAVLAVAMFAAGVGFAPGVAVVALGAIIAYCNWWLYDRLVCLDGGKDVCAVGLAISVEPPSEKSGLDKFDTDYSVNLMLAGTSLGDSQGEAEASLQGNLVKNQLTGVKFPINQDPDWQGHQVYDQDTANTLIGIMGKSPDDFSAGEQKLADDLIKELGLPGKTAVLHVEFEGGGVWDLLQAATAALAVASIAAALCAAGIIGFVACLILSLIAAAIALVGAGLALNDTANPNDVDAHLGEIHALKDWLVVKGSWVYDSAHEGWNEIHPIKHCQRIEWDDSASPSEMQDVIDTWCSSIDKATDPATVKAQGDPANGWDLHPSVDGCQPANQPPEPPPR